MRCRLLEQSREVRTGTRYLRPSVAIDSDTNTIDMGFNYALADTLPSGTPLVYYGAPGSVVAGLTDGTTYYVIQDYANPRLMRLTTVSAAQAIATAAAGKANYDAQYQRRLHDGL